MKKLTFAFAGLVLTGAVAFAGPIEDREALMKQRGGAVGALMKFAKGETAYDAAAVLAQLQALQANAEKAQDVAALWPDGSAGDSEAGPAIWSDPAGFQAAHDKFAADVKAAAAAAPGDAAALQASLGAITQNCGACHQTYRVKK